MSFNIESIDEGLYVSPQLSADHMKPLADAGIRSIINNRPDMEGGALQPASRDLEAAARAAGLHYEHLPVPPAGHSEADARRMVELVAKLPKPVVAFCRSGRRASALYGLGRRLAPE